MDHRPRWNSELYSLYKEPKIVEDIKNRRLGWAGHIIRLEEMDALRRSSRTEVPNLCSAEP